MLPDADVPIIDLSGCCGYIGTKDDFMSIKTGGSSDVMFESDSTAGRVFPLPTSDPAITGALWNDSGTVKVSAG